MCIWPSGISKKRSRAIFRRSEHPPGTLQSGDPNSQGPPRGLKSDPGSVHGGSESSKRIPPGPPEDHFTYFRISTLPKTPPQTALAPPPTPPPPPPTPPPPPAPPPSPFPPPPPHHHPPLRGPTPETHRPPLLKSRPPRPPLRFSGNSGANGHRFQICFQRVVATLLWTLN